MLFQQTEAQDCHLNMPISVAAPAPIEFPSSVQGWILPSLSAPHKQVVVPTPQQVPEVLIEEVVQSLQPMLVEEVEVEDDAPRFEQSERFDLPDFMREEVRLLDDDGLLPDEPIEIADSTTLKAVFDTGCTIATEAQIQTRFLRCQKSNRTYKR